MLNPDLRAPAHSGTPATSPSSLSVLSTVGGEGTHDSLELSFWSMLSAVLKWLTGCRVV